MAAPRTVRMLAGKKRQMLAACININMSGAQRPEAFSIGSRFSLERKSFIGVMVKRKTATRIKDRSPRIFANDRRRAFFVCSGLVSIFHGSVNDVPVKKRKAVFYK